MHAVELAAGSMPVPQLGLGTFGFGDSARLRTREVGVLREALAIGYRLFDTAEMYADGGAEEVVGQALADAIVAGEVRREEITVVSKVLPSHASRTGTVQACESSLRRLKLDTIDLYLLHWRGSYPLADTVAAFETLSDQGKIRHWGVSNFDVDDLNELRTLATGDHCAANQVYYSPSARGIEFDLLGLQRQWQMPVIAYSPIDQGALATDQSFAAIGRRVGATAAQVALAWVMRHPDVIAIPKAGRTEHLRANWEAAQLKLDDDALRAIDQRFAPPRRKRPLATT